MKLLILIGGNAGHGKSTFGEMLAERIPGSRLDAFARGLKDLVSVKYGVPRDWLDLPSDRRESLKGPDGRSLRALMQSEGDSSKAHRGDMCWAEELWGRFMRASEQVTISTDLRYPELELYPLLRRRRRAGVAVLAVRVMRPSVAVDISHSSESAIHATRPSAWDRWVVAEDRRELEQAADQLVEDVQELLDRQQST